MMSKKAPRKCNRPDDFILQKIEGHYYIHHLPTQTVFYLHSALYSYPDDIDENRYHHPVKMEQGQQPQYYLIINHTGAALSVVWIIVLAAESWFRKESSFFK